MKLQGTIQIPGDKSITHRALMLASLADKNRTINLHNWLCSLDCLATKSALEQMGVKFSDDLTVHSVGLHGLQQPQRIIDVGNSGTTIRLLTGILSGQKFDSSLTGDSSICKRPMARIIEPLQRMGAKITAAQGSHAPLLITGAQQLKAIDYQMPIASAQVKSAILLADLYAAGESTVTSPGVCRNHTEIMMKHIADDIYIPGDISSAAFFIVGATIAAGSDLFLPNIGVNPTRAAVLTILQKMGANITFENHRIVSGEERADLRVRSAHTLTGIDIPIQLISNVIDELPILCLAAACATGVTTIRGATELRYKESDRIKLMVNGLRELGIKVQEFADGLAIWGGRVIGGTVQTNGDHRIAMTFAIARLVAEQEIIIHDTHNIATSFPNFEIIIEESVYA